MDRFVLDGWPISSGGGRCDCDIHESLLTDRCSAGTNRVAQVRKDLGHPSKGDRVRVKGRELGDGHLVPGTKPLIKRSRDACVLTFQIHIGA